MRFNAKKCYIMHISNVTGPRFYQLANYVLSDVNVVKYLGVTLSDNLQWSPHISSVVSKAHQRLGFLRRNLRGCPLRYKSIAYQALVRSNLEYCAPIWDPTKKSDIYNLERIQRRSARWATNTYGEEFGTISVTGILKNLGWEELSDRRRKQRLMLLYNIVHSLLAVPPEEVNIHRAAARSARGSHNYKLQRPKASHQSSPLWTSPIFRTIPEWNNLPASIAEADSITTFKSRLSPLAGKP